MSEGWIKLYRNLRENWIWEDPVKLKWWIDMLLQANHQDKKVILGNEIILVRRGSFHTSELKLAQRWGTSKKSARTFLSLLQNDGMITMTKSFKGTTIEVSKYEDYQGWNEEKRTTEEPGKNENEEQSVDTLDNLENKNVKNGTTGVCDSTSTLKATFKEDGTAKEPCKNHKGTIQEPQRNREVYTNNNEKECKQCKEGEEGKKVKLPLLLFPTNIHKEIYKEIGEIAYRTWFMDANISDGIGMVEIRVNDEFKKNIIEKKYLEKLELITEKRPLVRVM